MKTVKNTENDGMKTVKIAILTLILVNIESTAAFIKVTKISKDETLNIACYENVNVNAEVGEGGTLQIITGDCHIEAQQGMGKFGDIVQITDLPSAITLGQIALNAIRTRDNIMTPVRDQKVLFQFNPSTGEVKGSLAQFLIEHVSKNQLNREIQDRGLTDAAERLKENNSGQQLELFVYYRRLFGSTGWFDLGQTLTTANNVAPTFNIAVDDSGKVMIDSDTSKEMQFFDLGQFKFKRSDPKSVTPQEISEHFKDLIEFKQHKQTVSGG